MSPGIGKVKIKLHRKMLGRVKQVSVTLGGDGRWYSAFTCDNVPTDPLPSTGASAALNIQSRGQRVRGGLNAQA